MPETHVLISSVKDEGPFLLEWAAHHLVLGFDRILVASNDCTDGTDALLDALEAAGALSHVRNVLAPGDIPQHAGYAAIRAAHPVDAAAWLMVLDADEFLNVHAGGHRVGDLTALAAPEVDVIALNARSFAGDPEAPWTPGPVTARFTQALAPGHKANTALKSLTRGPSRFRAIHNHSMVGPRFAGPVRVMDGAGALRALPEGEPLWRHLRSAPVREGSHRLAQVNHYPVKTRDAFALRQGRGRGAVASTTAGTLRHTDAYFAERAVPAGEERSVARTAPALAARMAALLADPAVAAAQASCEAVWATRTRAVRQASGWRQEAE